MKKRERDYSIEEKTNIILSHLGNYTHNYPIALSIAATTDSFTFYMLNDLARALQHIAKGKDSAFTAEDAHHALTGE